MTLTNRLSLFFLATLAVVLVGFSVTLYLLAERHLTHQLEERLGAAANALSAAVEVDPDGIEWEPHTRPAAVASTAFGDQLRWTVTTESGQVIDRSSQPDAAELFAHADAGFHTGHRNPRRFDHDGHAWQLTRLRFTRPSDSPAEPLHPDKHAALELTVAVPLEPVHSTLRTLAATLVGLTAAVLGLALVASRVVCRRALAPVARMAAGARAMDAADLAPRLDASGSTGDELADLGRAFNDLLDRLQGAFERERRFAGEASHQLRTPLAAVLGQVEVALRRERDPEEYRRVLESVATQASRLRRVVESLLFLARSDAEAQLPGVERVDLAAWARSHLALWAEHPRADDLRLEVTATEPVWASLHPDLFGELLDALVDNALKYSPSVTAVTLRVGRSDRQSWLEVEDRGCGIAETDVPQLFRPFFRSESARRLGVTGAGLGLAVAARVATALGGTIHVESTPDRGSRFRVTLPESCHVKDATAI